MVLGAPNSYIFIYSRVSINGWIRAFISEPRATVISQQRVFCWSEGDFAADVRPRRWGAAQSSNGSATSGRPFGADNIA